MDQEVITQDGEVLEGMQTLVPSTSMAVQLQKAEIDQLVTTARAFPRSLKHVQTRIMSMATLDEESAEECIYALPRGGKPIRGPSIRFAEILKQSYGNCQSAARVVHVDKVEKYVEAEGVFIDLETNSKSTARVRRRISGRNGAVFNDDMIIVTGNAACSIAMRNAILAGVPKPLWRRAYEQVQATITGDVTTLSENREKAFKALAAFGVKPEQVFVALGVEGVEDISVDHIATLRGMYSALKNGEATVEEMFVGTVKAASDHQKVSNPLNDEPAPQNASAASVEAEQSNTARETSALTGEPAIEQDTISEPSAPPADEAAAGEVAPSPHPAAAPLSGDEPGTPAHDAAGQEGDASSETEKPVDGLPAASPSSPLTDSERSWLLSVVKQLWPLAAPGYQDEVNAIAKDLKANVPADAAKLARDKATSIVTKIKHICFGEAKAEGVLAEIAILIGVEAKEIVT